MQAASFFVSKISANFSAVFRFGNVVSTIINFFMTVKLFAHRGFTDGKKIAENSRESLLRAHELGFRAVEFDVWLFEGRLVLKHDEPKNEEILPQFRDYFRFGNDMEYWIDCKNLSEKNCDIFLHLMRDDIAKSSIDLSRIFFAPFITDYFLAEKIFVELRKIFGDQTNVVAVCDRLQDFTATAKLAKFLAKNRIKFLSIDHRILTADVMKILPETKIFAWTVNEMKRLQELEQLGVAAVATDVIIPQA